MTDLYRKMPRMSFTDKGLAQALQAQLSDFYCVDHVVIRPADYEDDDPGCEECRSARAVKARELAEVVKKWIAAYDRECAVDAPRHADRVQERLANGQPVPKWIRDASKEGAGMSEFTPDTDHMRDTYIDSRIRGYDAYRDDRSSQAMEPARHSENNPPPRSVRFRRRGH